MKFKSLKKGGGLSVKVVGAKVRNPTVRFFIYSVKKMPSTTQLISEFASVPDNGRILVKARNKEKTIEVELLCDRDYQIIFRPDKPDVLIATNYSAIRKAERAYRKLIETGKKMYYNNN